MNEKNPETIDDQEEVNVERTESKTEETKSEKPKYVHNCTKCGSCCEKWKEIPIYIEDLQKWLNDGTIQYILPFIQLREEPPAYVSLVIQKAQTEDDNSNPSGCPLYDYENKICNVYFSMPIFCASYPLAYNGEKYYLVDKESPGLGNGSMTKDSLELARSRARDHFSYLISTSSIMPLLYAVLIDNIRKRSQEAMDAMSDEDKKQLEDLLSRSEKSDDKEKEEIEDQTED